MKRTLLSLLLIAAVLGPSAANAEVIERVVAVVGSDAIFLSELRRRASPFVEQAMQQPTEAQRIEASRQLYHRVLEQMVQEELFIQAADDMNVSVTNSELERAIGNVRNQAGLDEAQFWQAVAAQGFTRDQYRSDVRRQLLRLKVLNHRARDRVNITEDQVRQRYQMMVARARRQAQYQPAHIFIELPDGASATETRAARRRAQAIRDRIRDAEGFFAQGGVRLGTVSQGDLPPELEDALQLMDVDDISDPVRGPSGFHIFLLEGREQSSEALPAYDEVRMRVYQEMLEEAMGHQEELFIAELRRRALVDIRL